MERFYAAESRGDARIDYAETKKRSGESQCFHAKEKSDESQRLWNRNYCKVMAANFLLFAAFYLFVPLLPIYLVDHFGATKDTIGMVLSLFSVMALVCRPFSGYFVDSFPRKRVLMVCFVLYSAFFVGYLTAGTLLLFALVRTLHGGPFGALTVANSTVAIDVLPSSRRTEGIGYYGLSNNLAMALAPSIGVLLYRVSHSFQLLFWAALLMACVGMAVDSTIQLPHRPTAKDKPPMSLDRFFLLRGWLLGLNMVAFGLCFGVLSNYLAIYSRERMGITSGTGTYFMLLAAGLMLSRLTGARTLRQGLLTRNAAIGMLTSLVGYTIFILMPTLAQPNTALPWLHSPLLPAIGYYGSALLIGLGNGHMWPAFQNMIICVAHNNQRGTANSTLLIAWDVGMGLGVLGGGVVAELWGYDAAFWTVVVFNLLGVLTYFLATRRFFLVRNLNDSVR